MELPYPMPGRTTQADQRYVLLLAGHSIA